MQIKERIIDDQIVILPLSGMVVMNEADAEVIRHTVRVVLDRGLKKIVLDMKQVRFLNTAGLGVLIGILKTVRENSGEMTLASITGSISRILMVTDLIRVFKTFETVDEAVSSFN